jgi:hypothetical protein
MVMLETAIQSRSTVVSYGAKHATYTISHACEKRGNGKKARPKNPAKARLRQVLKITFAVFLAFS